MMSKIARWQLVNSLARVEINSLAQGNIIVEEFLQANITGFLGEIKCLVKVVRKAISTGVLILTLIAVQRSIELSTGVLKLLFFYPYRGFVLLKIKNRSTTISKTELWHLNQLQSPRGP
jgi:hypothetical protein